VADKKKRKSPAELQKELRDLSKPDSAAAERPPFDIQKVVVRVAIVLAVLWLIALTIGSFVRSNVPAIVMLVITVVVAGLGVWVFRYVKKTQALGSLLKGADTEEGRKEALKKLETDFKKGDVQAVLARAQLEMQEDPRKALATLESVDLAKQMGPIADQVRSMRAMIHLTLGEPAEARPLVDALEIGKQQDVKTRAMFAIVAGEAWGRTGNAKKAVETLELFNPEDPELGEMKVQLWRARAFAYAGNNDMKGAGRALRKLAELNPQLLGMFVGQKRIHPLLEREAKAVLMKMGAVPRKMVQRRL
jgi:hypothetical protein